MRFLVLRFRGAGECEFEVSIEIISSPAGLLFSPDWTFPLHFYKRRKASEPVVAHNPGSFFGTGNASAQNVAIHTPDYLATDRDRG
jgi:hypothetical protein